VDVNTFQISASDLLTATDIILKLPAFEAAVNASLQGHRTLPTTSVIINVLYENDYTGYGPDPNKTVASARKPAVSLFLSAFGMGGLFAEKVRASGAIPSPRGSQTQLYGGRPLALLSPPPATPSTHSQVSLLGRHC
jgi:hypothetical protein